MNSMTYTIKAALEAAEYAAHAAVEHVGSANYRHRVQEAHEMIDAAVSSVDKAVAALSAPAAEQPVCRNCVGQGWEPTMHNGRIPCSHCQPIVTPAPTSSKPEVVVCPECEGKGGWEGETVVYPTSGPEVVGSERCEVCRGTGHVAILTTLTRCDTSKASELDQVVLTSRQLENHRARIIAETVEKFSKASEVAQQFTQELINHKGTALKALATLGYFANGLEDGALSNSIKDQIRCAVVAVDALSQCVGHPVPTGQTQPMNFPGRRTVEREIESLKNPSGMQLNDGKDRVTLPGGVLQHMLRLIDVAAQPAKERDEQAEFEKWAETKYPMAICNHSLGAYSRGMKKCAEEAWMARALVGQPAQAVPSPELTWLYTHCRAIGMDCKSDSGKWEHDIALFTQNMKAQLEEAKKRPAQAVTLTDQEIIDLHDSMFPRVIFAGDLIMRNVVKFAREFERRLLAGSAKTARMSDAEAFAIECGKYPYIAKTAGGEE